MMVGLYGGTFDPVHNGHLILARDALETLGIERVIFIPNVISPHKRHSTPAPPELRLEMVRAAIRSEPGLEVDDLELRRGRGPSFTIDTVTELSRARPDTRFCYFIGADNVPDLGTWHRINELRDLVEFVVLSRGENDPPHPFRALRRRIDISATEIRERVAKGLSIRYLVPESVRDLIERHQPYRRESD